MLLFTDLWRTILATFLLHISTSKTQRQEPLSDSICFSILIIKLAGGHTVWHRCSFHCKAVVNSACHILFLQPLCCNCSFFFFTSAPPPLSLFSLIDLTDSSICGTDWCPNSTSEQRSGSLFFFFFLQGICSGKAQKQHTLHTGWIAIKCRVNKGAEKTFSNNLKVTYLTMHVET